MRVDKPADTEIKALCSNALGPARATELRDRVAGGRVFYLTHLPSLAANIKRDGIRFRSQSIYL
ncbi:hypothetical protein GMO17_09305 [Pseudomonas coronafaciens pv. coronafaciens]|uniref:Uncharacterized protein n=1 Tax=Pseudomonas coronafaciens pv. coronafaciens TaxID=235275 RepID=A0AAE6QH23_9PSED|nr:hypothetical protein GMO17_09305 [Pseudomonas coronafaciens pv. coronafaciens]